MFSNTRIKSARTTGALLALVILSWSGNLLLTQNWLDLFRGRHEAVVKPFDGGGGGASSSIQDDNAAMPSSHAHNTTTAPSRALINSKTQQSYDNNNSNDNQDGDASTRSAAVENDAESSNHPISNPVTTQQHPIGDAQLSVWQTKLLQAWETFENQNVNTVKEHQQKHVDVISRAPSDNKPQYDVTVATFATTAQLPRLLDLLSRWTGPVSMAVYIASTHDINALKEFYETNKHALSRVSFHVLFEKPTSPQEETYLPSSALRNLAMQSLAETEFLIPLNVEYVVNTDCYEILLKILRTNPRVHAFLEDRHFMVLPAFESRLDHESLDTAPSTVKEMVDRRLNRTADLVPMPLLRQGVYPTRFGMWSRDGPGDMYLTEYESGYEPVVLAYRKVIPSYHEALRGPWYSQVAMIDEAYRMGYKLGVLRNAFVYRIDRRNDPDPEPFAQQEYQKFIKLLQNMYEYPQIVHTVHNIDQRDYSGECMDSTLSSSDDNNKERAEIEQRLMCEWQNFTESEDLRRQIVSVIRPDPNRPAIKADITLATQGSVDRLDRLLDGASRWSGPISAAIYVTNREALVAFFDFCRQHHATLKTTSFHLFFEKINNARDKQYRKYSYHCVGVVFGFLFKSLQHISNHPRSTQLLTQPCHE